MEAIAKQDAFNEKYAGTGELLGAYRLRTREDVA